MELCALRLSSVFLAPDVGAVSLPEATPPSHVSCVSTSAACVATH